jgi:hypothetical protein
MHLVFAPSPRVRNSVRRLGPGLDTRAAGGYIVAPPSIHPNGNRYVWLSGRDPWSVPLPQAPTWLLDLLDPPRPERSPCRPSAVPQGTGYAAAALAREVQAVATAAPGTRNATLFRAAAALGRFAASGELQASASGPALVDAALAAGLPRHEAEATALSGLRTGASR